MPLEAKPTSKERNLKCLATWMTINDVGTYFASDQNYFLLWLQLVSSAFDRLHKHAEEREAGECMMCVGETSLTEKERERERERSWRQRRSVKKKQKLKAKVTAKVWQDFTVMLLQCIFLLDLLLRCKIPRLIFFQDMFSCASLDSQEVVVVLKKKESSSERQEEKCSIRFNSAFHSHFSLSFIPASSFPLYSQSSS